MKNLEILIQPEDPNSSVFSKIDRNGIRSLEFDLLIGREGLMSLNGEFYGSIGRVSSDTLQTTGKALGRGATCYVQAGLYKPEGRPVAIKTINAYDREKRHQVMKDIKILISNFTAAQNKGYPCNFIVNLYGAYFDQQSIKVILQLMDAGSLQGIIKIYRSRRIQPKISQGILAKIALQILCGLSFLHSNKMLHRDIKPANILMNTNGQVKISDFGISKQLNFIDEMSKTNVGTKIYMSPERISCKSYDYKSDIWSLGLVMIELATGIFPYESKTGRFTEFQMLDLLKQHPSPSLPKDKGFSNLFIDFVNQMLKKNMQQRASSTQLLAHPWLLKNLNTKQQISQWLYQIKSKILDLPVVQQIR